MAELNFDATTVQPDSGYDVVPAGWYNALIDESELKPTKDGSGAYLQVRYNIIDGQYANRKIFSRLNIRNSNPVAQEIAYKQLSAIAHAVGVMHVQDSSQLHGIPMKIKVKVRKDPNGQYDDANEVSVVKNINEKVDMGGQAQQGAPWQTAPAVPQMPAQAVQAAPQAAQAATPWQQPQAAQPWQNAPQQAPQQAPQAPAVPVQQAPAQAPQAAPIPAQQAPQQPAQAPQQAAPWQQPAQAEQPAQQPAQQAQSAVPPWAQPKQ